MRYLIILLILAFATSAIAAEKAPGLVGEWKFESESGGVTPDSSGSSNDGTITTAVASAGQFGRAYTYDGDDLITTPTIATFSAGGDFSIGVWVKRSDESAIAMILSQGDGTPSNEILFRFDADGKFRFSFTADDLVTDASISSTDWMYLVGTYRASDNDRNLYKDGALVKNDTASADLLATTVTMTIGRKRSDVVQFFKGIIDELRIWDRVLAPGEVRQNMLGFVQGGM